MPGNCLKKRIRSFMGLPAIDLQEEVAPFLHHLKGLVLNAGAGHRPLHLGLPTLACDFDETAPVDFLADLHFLPLSNNSVDSIITVAVLEHTRIPWVCVQEFYRVLKPGGTAVVCTPFLQPEHAVPHDFYRYTVYGLRSLLEWAGFLVERVERLGRQRRVFGWMLHEMIEERSLPVRVMLFPIAYCIAAGARTGEYPPLSIYSGAYAIARKRGGPCPTTQIDTTCRKWFYPLLVDPVTKRPLIPAGEEVRNDIGQSYSYCGEALDLRPRGNLSQDACTPWN